MAILTANKDGSSNAKPGDIVITGGGIYEKLADGTSKKLEDLSDFIGSKTTRDYGILDTIKKSYVARESSKVTEIAQDAVNNMANVAMPGYAPDDKEYINADVDNNGIVHTYGYDPYAYAIYESSSGPDMSTIIGGVVIGIIGLALLDRFIN